MGVGCPADFLRPNLGARHRLRLPAPPQAISYFQPFSAFHQMPPEFKGYFKSSEPWELGPLVPQLQMVGVLPTPWPPCG